MILCNFYFSTCCTCNKKKRTSWICSSKATKTKSWTGNSKATSWSSNHSTSSSCSSPSDSSHTESQRSRARQSPVPAKQTSSSHPSTFFLEKRWKVRGRSVERLCRLNFYPSPSTHDPPPPVRPKTQDAKKKRHHCAIRWMTRRTGVIGSRDGEGDAVHRSVVLFRYPRPHPIPGYGGVDIDIDMGIVTAIVIVIHSLWSPGNGHVLVPKTQ